MRKRKFTDLLAIESISCSPDHETKQSIKRPGLIQCNCSLSLDRLPSSLFAQCCSFLTVEIKVLALFRLNKRIKHELVQSDACYRNDAVQFIIDSRFDSALIASVEQSIKQSTPLKLYLQSFQQCIQSQLVIPYLPRVRSIAATFRITDSLKSIAPHTINQFSSSMINLRAALLNSTLRSLLLHECDSHGSLKQSVVEWLFEQLVQINQSIKLEQLSLKLYSSLSSVESLVPVSFTAVNWQWRALSLMTSLHSLHLIGQAYTLPSQIIIDSLPPTITRLQAQFDQSHKGCEWQEAFFSTSFLPLLEFLDINRVDDVVIAKSLSVTVMDLTRMVRPIRNMLFNCDNDTSINDTITRLGSCCWRVPVVLTLDISLEQLITLLIPLLEGSALPVLKCFMLSISVITNTEDVELTQLLQLLAKREIQSLSINVSGRLIASLNKDAVRALTQMSLLSSLTIRNLGFPFNIHNNLFDSSVDVKQLVPAKCWQRITTFIVTLVPPRTPEDLSILLSALPSLKSSNL